MAATTLTAIFGNIGFFLTGIYLIVAFYCLYARTPDALISTMIIGMICMAAWVPALWNSPMNMSFVHITAMSIALCFIRGKYSATMIGLLFAALLADATWLILPTIGIEPNRLHFPYALFWWQSVLNLLFPALCFITLLRCYNNDGKQIGADHDGFYARNAQVVRNQGG